MGVIGIEEVSISPGVVVYDNKRPPGLIAPLLRFWHLLGKPPKNTTKCRDLIFNEGIRLLNMADTSLYRFTFISTFEVIQRLYLI